MNLSSTTQKRIDNDRLSYAKANALIATDFVVGTDVTYKIDGNKAKIKTPKYRGGVQNRPC
jgi:uncharacterized protein YcfJ